MFQSSVGLYVYQALTETEGTLHAHCNKFEDSGIAISRVYTVNQCQKSL